MDIDRNGLEVLDRDEGLGLLAGAGGADLLDAALARIVSDALAEWDRIQGDTPDLLYHYTDVAGLIGICSSGSMWATNLRCMNDARELAHARKLMHDVHAEAKTKAALPAQRELIEVIESRISVQGGGYPDFYSVSFGANGDLLSQWRGYGSSGGGYAIGFESVCLVSPPSPGELGGVQVRPHLGVAVPYVSLAMGTDPDGRLPIRKIVQGPTADTETTLRSLELLLASTGYPDVDITVSSVPLRT